MQVSDDIFIKYTQMNAYAHESMHSMNRIEMDGSSALNKSSLF